jgi:uncharacterized membrane protein YoaK (UPF0700 family)
MFRHQLNEIPRRTVVFHWFLLCFNAGCINSGGFIATGRFVSHVTGFATLFGEDLVALKLEAAGGILSVPIFFLLGSFLSGLLVDRRIQRNLAPHYDYVMVLNATCLFLVALGGELSEFGPFGEIYKLKQVYLLLALLCLACGLQNAAITSSSGSSIRTTHLTGLTTDLGIGLARILGFSGQKQKLNYEVSINLLRGGSILAFVFGSGVGAWIFLNFGFRGFILSGLISLYAAWHGTQAK